MLPGDEFYLEAFWNLSTTRQIGMAQGPIPYDKVVMYGRDAGLDQDVAAALCGVIRIMDSAYMGWCDDEAERRRAAKR